MIGRTSRPTAGRIPAVLSIGLLLLLSACTHYGPMNRDLVSLEPTLAKKLDVENARLSVSLDEKGRAIAILGRNGAELEACRAPEPDERQGQHRKGADSLPVCDLLAGKTVTVDSVSTVTITEVEYQLNPHCFLVKITLLGTDTYAQYCPRHP